MPISYFSLAKLLVNFQLFFECAAIDIAYNFTSSLMGIDSYIELDIYDLW